jgi:anti-sigma factor RsiW
MPDVDAIAVLVGTVAAFVLGGAYYAAFGEQLASVSEAAAAQRHPPDAGDRGPAEPARRRGGRGNRGPRRDRLLGGRPAPGAGAVVGFPLVLWIGAVVHDKAPAKLAVIHAGDWLVKLLAISVLIAVLQ